MGANEAPPAIISIFLGDQIGGVVDQIIEKGYADSSIPAGMLDLGVKECPAVDKDPTDRTVHHHLHLPETVLSLEWLLHPATLQSQTLY